MKKLLLILLCLPMIFSSCQENNPLPQVVNEVSQSWEKTFNLGHGYSVQQTSDGGYIITGNTGYSNGDGVIYLIKTDASGVEQWSQTFDEIGDYGNYVQQTSDGGYIICGGKIVAAGELNENYDVCLIKTDVNGVEVWSKYFGGLGGQNGFSVQQTNDGGYIITGHADLTNNIGRYVYLIKTDDNGIEQWNKTFGSSGMSRGYSVHQTSDGGYIIGGETEVNGIDDVYLIKTDASGVEQWSQTFGGTSGDRGFSVQQTTDGGYVIAGYTQSFGVGYQNLYLIKTDDNGIEQWNKTYGGNPNSENWGNSVQQTTDGGYIICGSKYDDLTNSNGYSVVYLLKTDANGDINN